MNIGNEIKKLAVDNGMTLTRLAEIISEKKGKNYYVYFEDKILTINSSSFTIITTHKK